MAENEKPTASPGIDTPTGGQRVLLASTGAVFGVVLLALVGLGARVSLHRAFQVDEIEHVHTSYNLHSGKVLYVDFWAGHNPLLYPFLSPLVDPEEPVSSLRGARLLPALALLLNITLAAYCAFRLGGVPAATLAAGLLLSHTTMVERGIEVRPDGLLSLCITAALALHLTPGPLLRRFALQGVVLSLAFLFSKKAVFGCLAFGLLWLFTAVRERNARLLLVPLLAWATPVVVAAGILVQQGALDDYLRSNIQDHTRVFSRSASWAQTFSPLVFILKEGLRNLPFVGMGLLGLYHAFRHRSKRPGLGFLCLLCVVLIGSLWANPFPFPYLHVTVLPTLGILAGVLVATILHKSPIARQRPAVLLAALLILLASASGGVPRLIQKGNPGQEYQLSMLREVQRITRPEEPVFDLVGLYFRPDAYGVFFMTSNMMARYQQGGFPPIWKALRQSPPTVIMTNYRTLWLLREDRKFIDDQYVHYHGNLLVPGTDLSGLEPGDTREFEVLREEVFRCEGSEDLIIDGHSFQRGSLTTGQHTVSAAARIERGRLILDRADRPQDLRMPPRTFYINFD